MVHSALLGPTNTSVYRYRRGKIGGEGLRVSLPLLLAFLNHRSTGVGLRKRKGVRYPHGRRPHLKLNKLHYKQFILKNLNLKKTMERYFFRSEGLRKNPRSSRMAGVIIITMKSGGHRRGLLISTKH